MIYRDRNALISRVAELGYDERDMAEAGYTFETADGRRAIREATMEHVAEIRDHRKGPNGQ